ncbi:MFS transporter [Candidatus Hydrogenisulfobacillus filiaventi]|uniref:MFS transporter n=1 Tax=Candidatus Hydrogenisulfobacillus filiaventi TaxID=2707344 RepID=A0A6F8ZES0_9FIRM|nr:MFS transporter [Candidatus Hydrogenisulfobacillus filiaventi]
MNEARRDAWALVVIVTGTLIAAVDTTIVVLALPTMMRDLHASLSGVVWVIMAYLLVITLVATQVGRLGDMFGRVRMYEWGFVIFILGSLLCGLATTETALIGFRVLQGLGGALVTANSGAVIADTFPAQRRGRAYGFTSVGWNLGAILGILLGGFITTFFSWRYIFLINVPIGAFAVGVAWMVLRDRGERIPRALDWAGMITLGGGLFALLLAMVDLSAGPPDARIETLAVLGLAGLVAFALFERRVPHPLLDFRLFQNRVVGASFLAAFFQSLGNFAVLFLVIMYLQGVRGLTPLDASLLLVPGYLVGGLLGPVSGRLADRVGPVWPATVGLAVQGLAIFLYAHLRPGTPLGWVVAASVVNGVGSAGFFPANNAAVMKGAPPGAFGIASGMLRTFANVGMVLSFATAILVSSAAIPRRVAFAIFVGTTALRGRLLYTFNHGIHAAFYLSIGLVLVAAGFSLWRGPVAEAEQKAAG